MAPTRAAYDEAVKAASRLAVETDEQITARLDSPCLCGHAITVHDDTPETRSHRCLSLGGPCQGWRNAYVASRSSLARIVGNANEHMISDCYYNL